MSSIHKKLPKIANLILDRRHILIKERQILLYSNRCSNVRFTSFTENYWIFITFTKFMKTNHPLASWNLFYLTNNKLKLEDSNNRRFAKVAILGALPWITRIGGDINEVRVYLPRSLCMPRRERWVRGCGDDRTSFILLRWWLSSVKLDRQS